MVRSAGVRSKHMYVRSALPFLYSRPFGLSSLGTRVCNRTLQQIRASCGTTTVGSARLGFHFPLRVIALHALLAASLFWVNHLSK